MLNIKTELEKINNFNDLLPIVEKATVGSTFWGSRTIAVLGYEGTLDKDGLSNAVMKILIQKPEWSVAIHQVGKRVADQVDRVYREIDALDESNLCWLTRVFLCLRRCFNNISVTGDIVTSSGKRNYWKDDVRDLFEHPRPNLKYSGDQVYDPENGFKYLIIYNGIKISNENEVSYYKDAIVE